MSSNGRVFRDDATPRGVPLPTVESLKAMLGIAPDDDSKDAAIEAMLESSLALLETYCGRRFLLDDYQGRFLPIDTRNPRLLLRAFPVEEVYAVTRDYGRDGIPDITAFTGWKIYRDSGVLEQWCHGCCWCCCEPCAETIVQYRGGFPPEAFPADLADILTRLFFDRWNASGGSVSAGSSGGGTGEIKSATVDGMRLDYDLGGFSYKGAADVPPDLLPFAAALARYRAVDLELWGV